MNNKIKPSGLNEIIKSALVYFAITGIPFIVLSISFTLIGILVCFLYGGA